MDRTRTTQNKRAMFADPLIFRATNALLYAQNRRFLRRYRRQFGGRPNIANPQRYSERMLWRKLVDRNPQFVVFCDKLATKDFIQRHCPSLPVPRTLWAGRSADEIPGDLLRQDVLVKANHGSSFNYRVRAGQCDRAGLRQETEQWLQRVYGTEYGEWAYSQVEPKLFVEEAVGDAEQDLIEFQVRASNGNPLLGSVIGKSKTPAQWWVYLNPDGVPTRGMEDPAGSAVKPLPPGLDIIEPYRRAVAFARQLSVGVDYARFDFMWNGRELYGSEITVYPAGGIFDPADATVHAHLLAGWDLRQAHFLRTPPGGWWRLYAGALNRQWRITTS